MPKDRGLVCINYATMQQTTSSDNVASFSSGAQCERSSSDIGGKSVDLITDSHSREDSNFLSPHSPSLVLRSCFFHLTMYPFTFLFHLARPWRHTSSIGDSASLVGGGKGELASKEEATAGWYLHLQIQRIV
jgi:hypothetical protein